MPIGVYKRTVKDRSGFVKGELTVLRQATDLDIETYQVKQSPAEAGMVMWVVACTCGRRICISTLRLNHPFVVSCGCKRIRGLSKRVCKPGDNTEPCRRDCFTSTRYKAKQRGLEWALSYEVFCAITQMPCHYCNAPPSNVQRPKKVRKLTLELPVPYVYSGLDRVDNTKGYLPGNVVPCCIKCNESKNDMAVEEFREWAEKLYTHYIEDPLAYNG